METDDRGKRQRSRFREVHLTQVYYGRQFVLENERELARDMRCGRLSIARDVLTKKGTAFDGFILPPWMASRAQQWRRSTSSRYRQGGWIGGFFGAARAAYDVSAGTNDPFFSSVKTLLHCDGADAGTTFTDVIGNTWTANGNAQIDTAQFKFGTASGLGDGTGDSIDTPSNAGFAAGTGDCTYETFIRFASVASATFLTDKTTTTDTWYFQLFGGSLALGRNNVGNVVAKAWTPIQDTWYFLVFERSGGGSNNTSLWIDTARQAQATNTTDIKQNGLKMIGGGGGSLNGWQDEARYTLAARYSGAATITVPTAAFPDA